MSLFEDQGSDWYCCTVEPQSSLSHQQERSSSALRLSVPDSGPISQKQLHSKLTQRLQLLLKEKKQEMAHQEPATPQRRMSDNRVQQAQRNGPGSGKTKGQTPLEAYAAPNEAPVKAPATKSLQERIPANANAETKRALSSKEKRDAKVAESMVKLISSRYEINSQSTAKNTAEMICQSWIPPIINRSMFNMSWSSTAKKDVSGAVSLMKSHSKKTQNSSRKDVFDFSVDKPLAIGQKDRSLTNTSATSIRGINDSSVSHSTSKKGPPLTKEKRYVKKHLFSDTDTDYAMTEATAAPNRPHAAGRRPRRAAATLTKSYREPDTDDSQSESEKPPVTKNSSSDRLAEKTEKTHVAAHVMERISASKTRTKRFMKLERSSRSNQLESVSSTSKVQVIEFMLSRFNNYIYECHLASGQRPEDVFQETLKINKKTVVPFPDQMKALKESLTVRQTSFCPSPPFIERMRSAERSAPTLGLTCSPLPTPRGSPLPASHDPAFQDTPSPILLLPKPRSTVGSKGNVKPPSYYSAEKKFSTSKTNSIHSGASLPSLGRQSHAPDPPIGASAAEISPNQECLSPAPESPLSLSAQPLLTSTFFEPDKPSMPSLPQSPFVEDTDNHGSFYGFSKVSSVSVVSLSQLSSKSSGLTGRVKESPSAAVFHKTEKTPSSDRDLKSAQRHISGPSRKRHISSPSYSEEDEEWMKKSKMRGTFSPRLKPKKLFKSFTEVSADGEVSQVVSSSHMVSSSHWEAEVGVGDMDEDEDEELPGIAVNPNNMCQQFSSELKKKFQNRYKMMEVYNKQSLKTVQQHVSSLNMQVTKYRTQRLEQVQNVLLEEIHKLEQGDSMLKSMEKDLTSYWKKQAVAFHSYQEQETRRNDTLKKALQSNTCHSLEYEQRIFTSQMCLIRKDMKSVQDRLLSEMQEGEIQSVKKGLHALFFPDAARF
ncbi:putative synaptonemal complex protein 2 [Scophthalmus maximus]|uniref:Putative synaptonemal complex protein 2 n=1 Tax=Scophthalmus maximus TaxID=52904 RepID=A0A2U9BYV7_SCOMX|nr:putative synaptonemal complex protein 2 [Scophthalmus maximus]